MAEPLIGGAALGFAFTVVYDGGKYVYKVFKSSNLKELDETLNGLKPILDEIREVCLQSTSNAWMPKIEEFQKKLQQAQNIKKSKNPFSKANQKKKTEKEITNFAQNELVPTIALNQIKLMNYSREMTDCFSNQLETLCWLVNKLSFEQEIGFNSVASQFDEKHADFAGQINEISQQDRDLCPTPDMPSCLTGFEKCVMELKKFLLEYGVDVVGVTAIGGAGKSALATALCHHPEIKGYFKERIIYIVVSESPDLLSILKTMWRNIVGGLEPRFTNVEDAHNKLRRQIKSRRNEHEPILVVFDDIWQFSDLKELLFKGEQYITIVTTRDKNVIQSIPPWFNQGHYPLSSLQEEHALSLFCCCAFGMPTIPDTHNEGLVKQIQSECKCLPLALRVIGSSLYGKPDCVWEATRDALARGKAAGDNQINVLLKRLKRSIDVLSLGEKQCFLDLAVFAKGRIVPANELLDIWVYVRQMRRNDAVLLLWKFAACHLLHLKRDPWTQESTDDCMNSYSFTQHDVMRQLALYLAEQDNEIRFRRLYMPQKQSEFPPEWQTDGDHSSRAQIVSIHTGNFCSWFFLLEFKYACGIALYPKY